MGSYANSEVRLVEIMDSVCDSQEVFACMYVCVCVLDCAVLVMVTWLPHGGGTNSTSLVDS